MLLHICVYIYNRDTYSLANSLQWMSPIVVWMMQVSDTLVYAESWQKQNKIESGFNTHLHRELVTVNSKHLFFDGSV